MISIINWAGTSSDDLRVRVEHYPARVLPERSQTMTEIAGRNGALLMVDGNWKNYDQEYEIFISAERSGLVRLARAVAEWLESPSGYQRLEDSYEPDVYRMAFYEGGQDIESILNRFGRATISFNCKPQRYLKSGEAVKRFDTDGVLVNSTRFDALPFITVYGSGAGSVTVNGNTVTLSEIDGYTVLDSELMDAYKGTENRNPYISAAEFPALAPGENEISFDGGVTSLDVVPRWWTI